MDILRIVNLKMLYIVVKYVCKCKYIVNVCKVYYKYVLIGVNVIML